MDKIDHRYIAYLDVVEGVLCPKLDRFVTLTLCKKGRNFKKCPYYHGEREREGRKEILCSYPFEQEK